MDPLLWQAGSRGSSQCYRLCGGIPVIESGSSGSPVGDIACLGHPCWCVRQVWGIPVTRWTGCGGHVVAHRIEVPLSTWQVFSGITVGVAGGFRASLLVWLMCLGG